MYTAGNARKDFNKQAIDKEIDLAERTIEHHTKGGADSVPVWCIHTGHERMIQEMERRGFKAKKNGQKDVLVSW